MIIKNLVELEEVKVHKRIHYLRNILSDEVLVLSNGKNFLLKNKNGYHYSKFLLAFLYSKYFQFLTLDANVNKTFIKNYEIFINDGFLYLFNNLVDYVSLLRTEKENKVFTCIEDNNSIAYKFLYLIDHIIFELYLDKDNSNNKILHLIDESQFPRLNRESSIIDNLKIIKYSWENLSRYENPIRNRIILTSLHEKKIRKIYAETD